MTKYVFHARNKCNCMGQHYMEDDWTINVWANSIEELVNAAAERIFNSTINIASWYIAKQEVVVKDDEEFLLLPIKETLRVFSYGFDVEDFSGYSEVKEKEYENFVDDIVNSEIYKKLIEEFKVQVALGTQKDHWYMGKDKK